MRFTALLHHVDVAALERAFRRQKRQASAGVDGMTGALRAEPGGQPPRSLRAVHTGHYRPQPVRRVYIPKADGGRRPLGVPTLEERCLSKELSGAYRVASLISRSLVSRSGLRQTSPTGDQFRI